MPALKRKHANGDCTPPKSKRSKPTAVEEKIEEISSNTPEADQQKKRGKLSRFPISKATKKILKSRGVKYLFPIQYLTFDHVYEGKDVIGQASGLRDIEGTVITGCFMDLCDLRMLFTWENIIEIVLFT